MVVAFYGFQQVPDVRVVSPDRGWQGWFDEWASPLMEAGIRHHHLHNPFGLHKVDARGTRAMHIDQFELSHCERLRWLADRDGFSRVVGAVQDRGGMVQAYVGSPVVVRQRPQDTYLPGCAPGAKLRSTELRLLRATGVCGRPLVGRCRCWDRVIGFHITPLVQAGVDAIGFDDSADFHPGDCMDRLVRSLLVNRVEVLIEPWPKADREYPRVSWIIRELWYQRVRLGLVPEAAPVESVQASVYRIVPGDTSAGREEFEEINRLREKHGEEPFASFQEIVDGVRSDGHTPQVRAGQLKSGAIT